MNNNTTEFNSNLALDSNGENTFAVPQKLKAEDFSTADVDGVAHSAAGSGQMNYLMLQAKQTDATQGLNQSSTALGQTDIGNLPVADLNGHGAGWSAASENGLSLSSSTSGNGFGMAANGSAAASLENAGSEGKGSGVAVGSISAASGQGGTAVSQAFQNFDQAQNAHSENTTTGGDTTVETTNVANTTNQVTETHTTINNYFEEVPGDNQGGDQGPLLHLDVDALTDPALQPVHGAVDSVTQLAQDLVQQAPDLLSVPPSMLPTELAGTLDGVADAVQNTVQDLAQGMLDVVSVENVGTALNGALADVAAGQFSVASVLDSSGLLQGTDLNLHMDVRGLGPVDVPVGDLLNQAVGTVDNVLADVQTALAPVLEALPVGDVVDVLDPVLGDVTAELGSVVDSVASEVVTPVLDTVADLAEQVQAPLVDVTNALQDLLAPLDDLLAPVQELVNDTLGDLGGVGAVGDLLDGLGLGNTGADNDVLANLGPLGQTEDLGLDPLEGLLGDTDLGLDLDGLGNPADLLELNLDALNGDTPDGVDAGEALGTLVDNAGEVLDGMVGDTLPDAQGAVEDLLGGVDLGDLGTGNDSVGELLGNVGDLGNVLGGTPGTGEDLIGEIGGDAGLGGVLDNLNETIGDLLPPVAPVVESVVTPVVNTVVDALATLPPLIPPVVVPVVTVPAPIVNTIGGLFGGGGLFGHH